MKAPNVDIFQWLLENYPKAKHVLSFSNAPSITLEEYQQLTGFSFSKNHNLTINDHHGLVELKQALADNYQCAAENVVTTNGGTEANFIAFHTLLEKGDEFITEKPGYQPLWLTPEMIGAKRVEWMRMYEEQFQLDLNRLEQLITKKTKIIILTNLHNPSGAYVDKNAMRELSDIAVKNNIFVLVDEIFLDGAENSIQTCSNLPNFIVTSSITKIYGLGGLRVGWIIAPKEIAEQCQKTKAHTSGAASCLSEKMATNALGDARNILLQRFQTIRKKNQKIVSDWMKKNDYLEYVAPKGGMVCFPKYHKDISSIDLGTYLLNTHGVLICPGEYFNLDGHFRLSFNMGESALRNGLAALKKGLEDIS